VRIGTAPVNWNNPDVPEYRPWLPYRQMMDEFVEAGYDATEWGPGMPEDPAELDVELRSRSLAMIGAFVGLGFRDADRYDAEMAKAMAIVERLHATGGKLLIAAEAGDDRRRGEAGHVDPAGGLTDEQWRNLASGLHDLADRIAPLGMKVVFHNHVGTYVETPEETARLLDETDPAKVGWCLDCGHLAYGGGDNLAMLARYGDRVAHVHLKDVDGGVLAQAKAEGWSFGQALKAFIFPPLGEGIARVPDVVAGLLARGYDGWFVLEQDTCEGSPMEVALRNREYLEALLAGTGTGSG
jgi:inosose dehydratase